ncbi:hypothetical protein K438DRAFT_2079287 [Mycena galopus ATCC 62051]|nr:hypothetical protein K438DRAFT_2079287 [Mycena galopus ATCC 62051]
MNPHTIRIVSSSRRALQLQICLTVASLSNWLKQPFRVCVGHSDRAMGWICVWSGRNDSYGCLQGAPYFLDVALLSLCYEHTAPQYAIHESTSDFPPYVGVEITTQIKVILQHKVQLEIGWYQLVQYQVLTPTYDLKLGGATSSTPMRPIPLMQTTYRTHWSFGIACAHAEQLLEVPQQRRHQITNLKLGRPPARRDDSNGTYGWYKLLMPSDVTFSQVTVRHMVGTKLSRCALGNQANSKLCNTMQDGCEAEIPRECMHALWVMSS